MTHRTSPDEALESAQVEETRGETSAPARSTDGGQDGDVRRTVRWAWGWLLGSAAVLLVAALGRTGGTFVYVIDDPAIHLTVARRLADHGTWGIVAGEFQAASSSPLWTLLLAPTQLLVRGAAGEWVPLVLNLVAGLGVLHLLGPDLHRVLRPGRQHPLDVFAVGAVVLALLFLPGLAFYGMEHTLHLALVLATVLAVERRWAPPRREPPRAQAEEPPGNGDEPGAGSPRTATPAAAPAGISQDAGVAPARPATPAWVPWALLALATLTRGESAFVAVGLAVGLVVVTLLERRSGTADRPVDGSATWRERLGAAAGLGGAAAAALGLVAVVNLAFGQGLMPNSVLAKSLGDRGDTRRSLAAAFDRLTTDPWLLALCVLALLVLVREWRRSPGRARLDVVFPATVVLVATLLHVELAAVEPALRYEAYLLGLGVLVVLRVLPEAQERPRAALPSPPEHRATDGHGSRLGRLAARLSSATLVLLLVPFAAWQVHRTLVVPDESRVLFEQRYQVARFLDGAYDTDAIAIGELGYAGLYHDGPLTDVYGLGDHEVLDARLDDRADPDFWRSLQARRDFRVVAAYDFSLGGQQPQEWILVASWRSPDAHYPITNFWAAVPGEVLPLRGHLERYEADLPAGVEVTYNEWAPFYAASQDG